MEAAIAGPFPKPEAPPAKRRYGFFSVVRDPAYGALLYMLLSLATGIFYFVWAVTGISLSVAFAILIIGIPFALLFVGSVRILAHVEGRIVEGLLGIRMPRRLPAQTAADERLGARIRDALGDIRTWSSLLYLLLMLPLGVLYFVLAVVGRGALSLGFVGGSLVGLLSGRSYIQITDLPFFSTCSTRRPGLFLLLLIVGSSGFSSCSIWPGELAGSMAGSRIFWSAFKWTADRGSRDSWTSCGGVRFSSSSRVNQLLKVRGA